LRALPGQSRHRGAETSLPAAHGERTVTASMAKYWITDTQQEVIDECVQLHGGYGYMNEYLVCRMFADARVQRIYGGTNEIMKELISRAL
jgi:acyl-CoA dehydrogenase